MSTLVNGNALTASQKSEALRRYINRYTGDHSPMWVFQPHYKGFPLQFSNDADWFEHTQFYVNKDGSFHGQCWSNPTWPNNPELRT